MIFHSDFISHEEPLILVGGGEIEADVFERLRPWSDRLIAVDGGAHAIVAAGLKPEAVIGDLDSISQSLLSDFPLERVFKSHDQDSTDFDKALACISSPLVLATGFMGARFDHQLAVLSGLTRQPQAAVIVIGAQDVMFLAQPEMRFDLPIGSRFSLYPLGKVTGQSDGLKWPIDGIGFDPLGRIGTSNEVTGPVHLSVGDPHMLVVLPIDALAEVISSMRAVSVRWPAL